jgi:hypothetical protein
MKKVCIHWTAGAYGQSDLDYIHYHYTVGKDGTVLSGKFSPEANLPPLLNGHYAAHCGGGNSYCLGISLRGMAGYQSPAHPGPYPLTETQCEAAWKYVAALCLKYRISVTPDTVFTHYEFGRRNPTSDSAGKIDITHLPHKPELKPDQVGDYIRSRIQFYLAPTGG